MPQGHPRGGDPRRDHRERPSGHLEPRDARLGLPTSTDDDIESTLDLLGEVHDQVDAFTKSEFALFDHTEFARRAPELGLAVSGRRPLLTVLGRTVHSFRLDFMERGVTGDVRPSRIGLEIALFQSRRRWLGEARVYE